MRRIEANEGFGKGTIGNQFNCFANSYFDVFPFIMIY